MKNINPKLLDQMPPATEWRHFSSLQLQMKSVTDLGDSVSSILEIGSGNGYFTSLLKNLKYEIKTSDIRPLSNPNYLGDFRSAEILEKFDLVAAFEMLQHIPYAEFSSTLQKMSALSNKYILISVPSRVHHLELSIHIPRLFAPRRFGLRGISGSHSMSFTWEWPRAHDLEVWKSINRPDYWNPHYWEVGRRSYPRSRVLKDIEQSGLKVLWHKYNPYHTYHLFVLAEKTSD